MLGIVYRSIADHLIGKAGLTCKRAHTGAVTFIQRFGSVLNLNIHVHMLFLDGVYPAGPALAFQPLPAPTPEELQRLVEQIAAQVGRVLERAGVLVRQAEQAYLELESGAGESAILPAAFATAAAARRTKTTAPRAVRLNAGVSSIASIV